MRQFTALFAALSTLLPVIGSAQTLPPRIAEAKVLKIAVNGTYPPMESVDPATNKLVGFDIDLGEAIGMRLGLAIEWQDGAFAQLIPAVQSGRADMILSGISDLPARRASLDFIDYLNSGAQFYTLESNSAVNAAEDLCGKTVGTVLSTSFPANIEAWSAEHCVKSGKAAITVAGVDRMPLVATELQQGRIDGAVRGSETLPTLMAQEPNTYKPLGAPFTVVLQGIAFPKDETALRDAVLAQVRTMFTDGTYAALIEKWHLQASAAKAITMNGAPLP